jgi:predicted transcriptional regulator
MTDNDSQDVSLSALQLDVMRVLWSAPEATVAEIAASLEVERGLAHTTVATVLTRLAKRGLVAVGREGRQLVYQATVAEPEVRRSMVGDLLKTVFQGDAQALLAHLVSEEEIAEGDLAQAKALLAKRRKGSTP